MGRMNSSLLRNEPFAMRQIIGSSRAARTEALALDGSSRRAATRPFWGRRNTALLLEASAGPSATGNLKSETLPKWGRLKYGKQKVIIR